MIQLNVNCMIANGAANPAPKDAIVPVKNKKTSKFVGVRGVDTSPITFRGSPWYSMVVSKLLH